MARVSVIPAFINLNLRNESLVHCINVADAKAVVYETDLAPGTIGSENILYYQQNIGELII